MMRSCVLGYLLWAGVTVPAAAQLQAGGFVARRGTDEVTRELFQFDGRSLRSQVELSGRGLVLETEVTYDQAQAPVSYTVRARAGSGGPVIHELHAVFADSVRWRFSAGTQVRTGTAVVTRPMVVMQDLVFSHLAILLRGYNRRTGGRQVFHAWQPETGAVARVAVTLFGTGGTFGTVDIDGVTTRVTLDESGRLLRAHNDVQNLIVEWQAGVELASVDPELHADTVPPPGVREEPYRWTSGSATLHGTLADAGAAPGLVALIVAGGGATDRDGNAPPGVHPNTYAQLAWALAARGIASVRFDKRGVGESAAGVEPAMVTFDDLAEDVVAGVAVLARDPRFRGVVLIGHGEGGWLAIRAAVRGAPVAGLALLAVGARPYLEMVRQQAARQLDSAQLVHFDTALARYLRGDLLVGLPTYLEPMFRPSSRRFTESLVAYDALAELRRVERPVLVVQGGADARVSSLDAQRLGEAARTVEVVTLPGATHFFKPAALGEQLGVLVLSADPRIPIAPELVETIVAWVGR